MEGAVRGQMYQLFRSDEPSYQPVHPSLPLAREDGDAQASLGNLKRLGLVVQDIWVRKGLGRVLLAFNTGEQYLALGLGKPDALAFIASGAGYGDFEELRTFYACLPQDYDGKLPAASEPRIRPAHDNLDLQDSASAEVERRTN